MIDSEELLEHLKSIVAKEIWKLDDKVKKMKVEQIDEALITRMNDISYMRQTLIHIVGDISGFIEVKESDER